MSIDLNSIGDGWQPAVNETLAEKLEGRLLACIPLSESTRKNDKQEDIPVTITMVWDISEKDPTLFGKAIAIAWTVVRDQLHKATQENPFIVGRLKKAGRAYVLDSPRPEEVAKVSAKLKGVLAAIPLIEMGDIEREVEEAF